MLFCKEIWALVWYHRLERFGITLKEPIVGPIEHEFYASFRDQESWGPYDAIWEIITVRGEEEEEGNDDYKEEEEKEEDREQDSQEEDDDNYDVAFQLQ
ncbi:hypothetical protein Godav_026069 [Gossypium davidsonii]|uniref:Uncharacterized protein n=1 Tax=Gossypium davidsonii TaxID=34287 RepID=A0A7J8T7X9_GOSDV|nr:hypothetical protein [Gossypium davidsonii]